MPTQATSARRKTARGATPTPTPSLVGSLGFMLNKVGQELRERFDAALSPLGLVSKQYGVLAALSETGPMSQQALGDSLGIDRTTMVSVADGLESLGVAFRQRDPKDRRVQLLMLTDKGTEVFGRARALSQAIEAEYLAELSKKDLKDFQRILARLYSKTKEQSA